MAKEGARYEIRLKDHLDHHWQTHFEGMGLTTTYDSGGSPITILSGYLVDQSQLHGILATIRDSGMTVISINSINKKQNKGEQK